MGNLSANFDREEFECKCQDKCGFDTVDAKLLEMLQAARDEFGPITINSACRCDAHNKAVGGSDKSQHKLGRAADIVGSGLVTVRALHKFFDAHYPECGMGKYTTFLHIDSRGHKARWEG